MLQPANATLYLNGRDKAISIKQVRGFKETGESTQSGKVEAVCKLDENFDFENSKNKTFPKTGFDFVDQNGELIKWKWRDLSKRHYLKERDYLVGNVL